MNEIEYKDVLDIEWALRSAELRAKTHWDDMVIYKGTDSCLYEMAYEKVKELRDAQKKLRSLYKVVQTSEVKVKYAA
jgi:hypothetical protein